MTRPDVSADLVELSRTPGSAGVQRAEVDRRPGGDGGAARGARRQPRRLRRRSPALLPGAGGAGRAGAPRGHAGRGSGGARGGDSHSTRARRSCSATRSPPTLAMDADEVAAAAAAVRGASRARGRPRPRPARRSCSHAWPRRRMAARSRPTSRCSRRTRRLAAEVAVAAAASGDGPLPQPGLDDDLEEVPAVAEGLRLLRFAAGARQERDRHLDHPGPVAERLDQDLASTRTDPASGPRVRAGRRAPPDSRRTGR